MQANWIMLDLEISTVLLIYLQINQPESSLQLHYFATLLFYIFTKVLNSHLSFSTVIVRILLNEESVFVLDHSLAYMNGYAIQSSIAVA